MIRCTFEELQPGMVLGQSIFTDDGETLLGEGTALTEELIRKLNARSDITVFLPMDPETGNPVVEIVSEEDNETLAAEEPLPEEAPATEKATYQGSDPKKEMLLDLNYVEDYKLIMRELRVLFDRRRSSNILNLDAINGLIAKGVLNKLCDGARAVTQIHNMPRKEEDYLLHHSLHVAILAGLMGRWLRWPVAQRQKIILAGLLHDVGKLKIATSILDKPSRLTPSEWAIINKHPMLGYDLLEHSGLGGEKDIMLGVLQHHEREDGSGYPAKLRKGQISSFGRILGILDIYDAMASNRSYARRSSPFDIFNVIQSDVMGHKLDPEYGILFVKEVCQSLMGNWVRLTNGEKAKIVYIDQSRTSAMPIVETESGKFLDTGTQSIKVKELLTYLEAIA